jgi:ribosomal protein S18 acetylase RimI-like enzyme
MGGYDGRRGIVYHLAVAREDRQKGIGRALMEALEERLRSKGCLKAYLLMTKENEAAHFYAENGWQPMDLHIYGKDLS